MKNWHFSLAEKAILAFTALYLAVFTALFIRNFNVEFIAYVAVIIFIFDAARPDPVGQKPRAILPDHIIVNPFYRYLILHISFRESPVPGRKTRNKTYHQPGHGFSAYSQYL